MRRNVLDSLFDQPVSNECPLVEHSLLPIMNILIWSNKYYCEQCMQSQDESVSLDLPNSPHSLTRKETFTDYRTVKLECSIVVNYEDTEQENCEKEKMENIHRFTDLQVLQMTMTLTMKTS